ncbi:MAG: SIS domain-containing protein [Anaerolineales bacterium]|nr:SIS domain-containing protein [Anaerolineales bacterium]
MTVLGQHTLHEIQTQPAAWQEALAVVAQQTEALQRLWATGSYDQIIFTGCGSTYYLSLAGAALVQELTGRAVRAVPGGELVMYPASAYVVQDRTLLITVSRSGETSETLQAVKQFRQNQQGEIITITNYPDRPLARQGDVNLIIPAGQEQSIAQTRSFASMYVAVTALAALLAHRQDLLEAIQRLPEVGQRLLNEYSELAQAWGSNLELDRFYFLGSGPRYGLACETNLKMKEMSLTHSEPFHFLEFRHGPISMAGPGTLVIGLLSAANRNYEAAVLQDAQRLGGQILTLGESDTEVAFESGVPEAVRNVLYLPVLQLLACRRALAKGLNPDLPNNLEAVVRLDLI